MLISIDWIKDFVNLPELPPRRALSAGSDDDRYGNNSRPGGRGGFKPSFGGNRAPDRGFKPSRKARPGFRRAR